MFAVHENAVSVANHEGGLLVFSRDSIFANFENTLAEMVPSVVGF